ncbi:MAG TPA: hypothetical protein ENK18_07670 [Deltaproteobacteria bacterium]|nr:hypothetical protein [Deltaproteobacteria bacterium]
MSRAADRYFDKWFDNQQGEEEVMATVLMSGAALRDAAERAETLLEQRGDLSEEIPTVLMSQSEVMERAALEGAVLEHAARGRTRLEHAARGRTRLEHAARGQTRLEHAARGRTRLEHAARGRTRLEHAARERAPGRHGPLSPPPQLDRSFDFEPFLLDPEADQTEIRTSPRETPVGPGPTRASRAALAAIPIGVLLGALVGMGVGSALLFAAALTAL